MSICDCYCEEHAMYNGMPFVRKSVCNGTKEREECNCGGNKAKCDFYPEVREKATKPLNTAEMWIAAQKDGETYVTDYMKTSYSKDDGFWSNNDLKKDVELTLNDWMNAKWKVQERRQMTKKEAEREFGIKIEG